MPKQTYIVPKLKSVEYALQNVSGAKTVAAAVRALHYACSCQGINCEECSFGVPARAMSLQDLANVIIISEPHINTEIELDIEE